MSPKVMQCQNGHFYDAERFPSCPYCAQINTAPVPVFPESVAIATCENGHSYDARRFSSCPYCVPKVKKSSPQRPADSALSQFRSCSNMQEPYLFISYAHSDASRIRSYFEILENNHFRYWYDEGLPTGKEFYDQISKHIKGCVQFILFLSENAQNSDNVRDEIHIAYKYKKNILVVYIEDVELDDGLELALDRKQNLLASKYSEQEIKRRFYFELSKDALNRVDDPIPQQQSKDEKDALSIYEDFRLLSKSQMSEVYSAKRIGSGCKVLIKKIYFEGEMNRKAFYQCYMNEKRTLDTCICPFLPQLIDFGETENSAYIVETFLQGEQLDRSGGYSEHVVINLGIKVAQILKYFYHYGIVHCDLKPENLLMDQFGQIYLVDFGSCKFIADKNMNETSFYTMGFAAPEQYTQNGKIDFRTDIYALGKTMLYLLAGDKISSDNVFRDNISTVSKTIGMSRPLNTPEVKIQYLTENLSYYDPHANPKLDQIISRMISEKKENRYNSFDDLIRDLTILQSPAPYAY